MRGRKTTRAEILTRALMVALDFGDDLRSPWVEGSRVRRNGEFVTYERRDPLGGQLVCRIRWDLRPEGENGGHPMIDGRTGWIEIQLLDTIRKQQEAA